MIGTVREGNVTHLLIVLIGARFRRRVITSSMIMAIQEFFTAAPTGLD
jgi:hypothetical protein